jgi:hypothetical protein
MTPLELAVEVERVSYRLRFGCGNGGCQIKEPTGMHTNAGCDCSPLTFSRRLLALAVQCEEQGHKWDKEQMP